MAKGRKTTGAKERPEVVAARDKAMVQAVNPTPLPIRLQQLEERVADLEFKYTALVEEHTAVVNELYKLRGVPEHRHYNGVAMTGAPATTNIGQTPEQEHGAPAPAEGGPARDDSWNPPMDPDHPAWRG